MKHIKAFETNESEVINGKYFIYIKNFHSVDMYGIYYKNSTEYYTDRIGLFVYDFESKTYQLELDNYTVTSDQLQELAEFSKDPQLFSDRNKYNL